MAGEETRIKDSLSISGFTMDQIFVGILILGALLVFIGLVFHEAFCSMYGLLIITMGLGFFGFFGPTKVVIVNDMGISYHIHRVEQFSMKWKDIISIKAKTWETGRRYVWLNGKHYSHTWTAEKDLPEDQIENLMRALSENGKEFDHIIIENLDPPEHSGTTDK